MLDGCWETLARVGCLGSGKAYQFGPCKSEGGSDECGTETFEAVVEGARVVPVFAADVATLGSATAVKDDPENAANELATGPGRKEGFTYMNPITAMTLMIENTNSASP